MQQGDRQLQNINLLRGLQSDDRSWSSENWSRNFQTKQYADSQAQQTTENQWYGAEWDYGVGQDTKTDAQNRVNDFLAAGGSAADLDPALVAASGYTARELAAYEKYYAQRLK
ncbi:MAG TPA: hypothetical protein VN369_06260 [Terriglobales bacterium]|nr:hypothetical protein [Terriglobales bacterium]